MKQFKSLICLYLCILLLFTGCTLGQSVENSVTESTTVVENTYDVDNSDDIDYDDSEPVTVSDEVKQLVDDTISDIDNGEDIATNEIIESSQEEEANVVDESLVESDAVVEQENVAYEGTNSGKGLDLLGTYQGLTYYSQRDSRWANVMYSSTNNKSQTMSSSACGPTSAAMVVSSSKGAILPTTMAQLFVDNGYRTANNGTAWACWSFVADYFDFDFYKSTSSYDTMLSYLKTDKDKDGVADYFVVVSCNSGLWTSSGHYIVLVADNNGTITVYDPYLYTGKFNTASRKAAGVVVSGNSAFVSESSFKKYSNAKGYWIFSNDQTGKSTTKESTNKSTTTTNNTTTVNYTRYVATQSDNLNVRSGPGTTYSIVGSLSKGEKVNVIATSGTWSKIGKDKWVSTSYLSASKVSTSVKTATTSANKTYKTKVGSTYKLKSATTLYSKSNLSGTEYNYKANTSVKVINHVSTSIDYIYVSATNRYAYVSVSKLNITSTTSTIQSTVGQYKTLKTQTTLYSKSDLTGTKYEYLAGTQVKIVKNISNKIDYIYVVKTGRYAYINVSAYK
jgi:uncharacterized protein YgiM (DUF1202 family)